MKNKIKLGYGMAVQIGKTTGYSAVYVRQVLSGVRSNEVIRKAAMKIARKQYAKSIK